MAYQNLHTEWLSYFYSSLINQAFYSIKLEMLNSTSHKLKNLPSWILT